MIEPRLLSRKAAAAYVGLAPGTFDRLVKKGVLPARLAALPRWDIRTLDATIDGLSGRVPDREGAGEDFITKWRRERGERKRKQP